jgi:hypothetical protein
MAASELTIARQADLTKNIPARPFQALTGSQFGGSIAKMDSRHRERAVLDEIVAGDLPEFLRKLVPVELKSVLPGGETLTATIFVMPDYLAIGSDGDYLRMPMNLHTATAIAARFGFVLPTRKMVDAIYNQSAYHFSPEPMPAGPQMSSTQYYRTHNDLIEKQSKARGIPVGELVSGHKKDVVMTNRLAKMEGRIAIYGWHRGTGAPIQPLSTVHGACYEDYSHGIRLVSQMALMNGVLVPIGDILRDSSLARVLSDEGSIGSAPGIFTPFTQVANSHPDLTCGANSGSSGSLDDSCRDCGSPLRGFHARTARATGTSLHEPDTGRRRTSFPSSPCNLTRGCRGWTSGSR